VTSIRRATPADRAFVVQTVIAAFHDDPAWHFMMPTGYHEVGPHFAGTLFDLRVGSGDVWVADDGLAVSMWEPPGGASLSSADTSAAWEAYRAIAGEDRWDRLSRYDKGIDDVRPITDHWYLGVLATHPDHQGRGLARAVTAPIRDLADSQGLECCLETSKPTNKAIYAALGFTEVSDIEVVGGPPTWWLRHPPTGLSA